MDSSRVQGRDDIRYGVDQPEGFAASVVACVDASLLRSLSVWPRMVAVFEDADLLPVADVTMEASDPAGVLLVTLADTPPGTWGRWWGDKRLAVVGGLPLPDADVWWTWLRGSRLYGRHEDLMRAANVAGLPEPTRMPPPSEVNGRERRVVMLGGPMANDVMTTTCSEIEMPGVLVGGRWHRPQDVDPELLAELGAQHVYYRLRRRSELAAVTDAEWPMPPAAWSGEWVATFEGVRPALDPDWRDVGVTTEPGTAGVEREALVDLLEETMRSAEQHRPHSGWRPIAEAVADVLLGDPVNGHVQCEGEADPDDVLVAIVDGMDGTSYPGPLDASTRAGGLVESALDVLRVLDTRFTLHPRPAVTD